jgi:sugar/nucleoside kinase (ribokinase family)
MSAAERKRVACVGVYILDVLTRPVDALPTTQQAVLVDEIVMAPAGTAGGTAVDLARLGHDVLAVGAVGDDDAGEFLVGVLRREGIDTSAIAVKPDTATAATVLPISSTGVRPAWHVRGATVALGRADLPMDAIAGVDALHYGGVSALPGLDGEVSRELLAYAKEYGVLTTADCLGIKRDDALAVFTPSLPYVDVFMPNRGEVELLTGLRSPEDGARALHALGPRSVIVKLDADGCFGVGPEGEFHIPAFDVPVVDTTGCGDAFCSGVITGLLAGWTLEDAAWLGTAAGAQTAGGLGSVAGVHDLDDTMNFLDHHRAQVAS